MVNKSYQRGLAFWGWLAGIVVVVFLGVAGSSAARAQEPGVFEVVVEAETLQSMTNSGPVGQFVGSLTAFSGRTKCVTADTTVVTGDIVLALGEEGQPAACSQDGAIVTFVNASCYQLAAKLVLRPGTTVVLDNLAPLPPGPPPNCTGNPDAGFGPFFDVVMPLALLQQPAQDATFAEFFGGLTAYVDGVECVHESTTGRTNDLILRLGHPDQPDECSREGATVVVVDDYCRELIPHMELVLGASAELALATTPPHTQPVVACVPVAAAPEPPSVATTPEATVVPGVVIAPPSVGDAGLVAVR